MRPCGGQGALIYDRFTRPGRAGKPCTHVHPTSIRHHPALPDVLPRQVLRAASVRATCGLAARRGRQQCRDARHHYLARPGITLPLRQIGGDGGGAPPPPNPPPPPPGPKNPPPPPPPRPPPHPAP